MIPSTPSSSTARAWRCHQRRAAGEVKSTIEPVPIHQRPTQGFAVAPRTKWPAQRALLVVRRGPAVQALGLGVRGRWPSAESRFIQGVTQTTVRTPSARIRRISPGGSGNWYGLKRQVLYWVSQGESITIASSGSSCSR